MKERNVIVVGAGSAGMMAAITAAGAGARVTVVEPNERWAESCTLPAKAAAM